MQWGRPEVATCTDDPANFPNGFMGNTEMFGYFEKGNGFSLTKREVKTLSEQFAFHKYLYF